MMSKFIFPILFFPILINAQPVVTEAIIPGFQDSIHMIKCEPADFQENAFGADQTWNFSGLLPDGTVPDYFFKFFNPINTPYSNLFPNAELAAINADSQYIYYALENNSVQLIGLVTELPGGEVAHSVFDNSETEEVFPITYQNTWADDFEGENFFGGFSSNFSGDLEGEVDAYGTLILPTGTYENVLRLKEERSYMVTGSPVSTKTHYRYVTADFKLWLLSMETTDPPLIYYNDNPQIINAIEEPDFSNEIKVKPNPLRLGETMQLESGNHQIHSLEIFDESGKKISAGINATGSTVEIQLNGNLASGIYFIYGKTEDGFFTKKIAFFNH